MGSVFGSKPSEAHVIWRSGRNNDGKKKFDFEYLELWAAHFGVDFEQWTRVDHDRADEPREHFACVFRWSKSGGRSSPSATRVDVGSQRARTVYVNRRGRGVYGRHTRREPLRKGRYGLDERSSNGTELGAVQPPMVR